MKRNMKKEEKRKNRTKTRTKAIVLFSGGLDSILATKMQAVSTVSALVINVISHLTVIMLIVVFQQSIV